MAKPLGTLVVKVKADTGSLNVSLKRAQKSVQNWGTKTQRSLANTSKSIARSFRKLLTPINALGASLGAAFSIKKVVQAVANYETALVGVVKTTGLAGKELTKFEEDMSAFTRRFAIGKTELLELAQAAGQLGVETKDLAKFTKIMAEMAKASDVAGEEGAKAIARLLTVTQEGVGVADNFTSALVGLGNSAKASESEILEMSTRVAQATAVFNVSSVDVLGISTALKELGARSESAGSSVGRAMIAINASIQAGGKEAAEMARVMGVSVEQLAADFKDNAFNTFLTFLDRLGEQGTSATETLKKFKIAGAQNTAVLLTLAGNMDIVRAKLGQSSDMWTENTARVNEASIANETSASKFQILKNNISEVGIQIGLKLLPAIKSILTEINFVLDESESRAERFTLFIKAKTFDLLNAISAGVKSVGTLIVSVFVKAFLEVREALQMALKGMLIEIEGFVNSAAGALNSILPSQFELGTTSLSGVVPDYEAPSFDQVVLDVGTVFGVESSSINPFQNDLDDAIARATADRGVDARNGLPDVQDVSQVADEVKKVADELDRVAGVGPNGNPQGDRSIDTTLLGGSGSKEAVKNIETVKAKLVKVTEELTTYQQEIADFGSATFDGLTNFVTEFAENGTIEFKKFANQAIAELARIQLKALATNAILGLANSGGKTGSIFGGVASFLGIGGARADGGPVSGGQTYLVGERGPELFSPKRSGNIIPNDAIGNSSETSGGLAFTQVNHYDGNPNEQQMAVFAQQTKNSAIEGVMEIIAHGGQPAKAFSQ
jgi:TP901 family phage tail tape measure protein